MRITYGKPRKSGKRRYVTGDFVGWEWYSDFGPPILCVRIERERSYVLLAADDLDESLRWTFEQLEAVPARPQEQAA